MLMSEKFGIKNLNFRQEHLFLQEFCSFYRDSATQVPKVKACSQAGDGKFESSRDILKCEVGYGLLRLFFLWRSFLKHFYA